MPEARNQVICNTATCLSQIRLSNISTTGNHAHLQSASQAAKRNGSERALWDPKVNLFLINSLLYRIFHFVSFFKTKDKYMFDGAQ